MHRSSYLSLSHELEGVRVLPDSSVRGCKKWLARAGIRGRLLVRLVGNTSQDHHEGGSQLRVHQLALFSSSAAKVIDDCFIISPASLHNLRYFSYFEELQSIHLGQV